MYSLKYCNAFKAYEINKEYVIKKIKIACVYLKNEAFVVDINDDVWHILNNVPRKLEELCNKGVKQFEYCYSTVGDDLTYYAIVLIENGDVYGWGKDGNNLISEQKESYFYKLCKKEFKLESNSRTPKFDKITIGQNHCMGVTKDNRLILWGDNRYGQLGTEVNAETKPFKVFGVEKIKRYENQIENFEEYATETVYTRYRDSLSCIFENCFCILCFGYGFGYCYRQSLCKKADTRPIKFDKLIQLTDNFAGEGYKIKQIACGSFHSLVLLKSGDLYGFGCNSSGQLGIIPESTIKQPTIILKEVDQVVTTGIHTLALKFDRTLFAMGDNSYSQLGSLKPSNSNIPIEISMKFVEISTINGLSLGKGMDGKIYCWGYWGSESEEIDSEIIISKELAIKENVENIQSTSTNNENKTLDDKDITVVENKNQKSSPNAVISSPQRVYCKTFAEIVAKRFSITHYTIRGDDFEEPIPEKPYLIEPELVSVLKDDAEIEAENLVKRVKNNNFEIDVLKARVEVVERRPNITVENIAGNKVTSSLVSGLVVTSGSTFNISDVNVTGISK